MVAVSTVPVSVAAVSVVPAVSVLVLVLVLVLVVPVSVVPALSVPVPALVVSVLAGLAVRVARVCVVSVPAVPVGVVRVVLARLGVIGASVVRASGVVVVRVVRHHRVTLSPLVQVVRVTVNSVTYIASPRDSGYPGGVLHFHCIPIGGTAHAGCSTRGARPGRDRATCQNRPVTRSRKPAVLRGFAASSVSIFVALAGHVTAGGQMPGPLGILVPWVLSLMVCVLLAGRKLSATRLSASVAASQFLFHVLFVLGTVSPSGSASSVHVHGGPLVLPESAGLSGAVVADGTMWLGHAIAALITVLALHRGERMLCALRDLAIHAIRWLRRRLTLVILLPRVSSPRVLVDAADERHPDSALLATLRGRAPPVLSAV